MSKADISAMMTKAMESIKGMLDIDAIVGKPVYSQDNTLIIPVSKLSVGFLTAGGEIDSKFNRMRDEDLPIGGIGGGVSITPLAFLVVSNGESRLIKVYGDGVDRWMEIFQATLRSFSKE